MRDSLKDSHFVWLFLCLMPPKTENYMHNTGIVTIATSVVGLIVPHILAVRSEPSQISNLA